MLAWRTRFPFEFALMMGDNLYGSESPGDYEKKFSPPVQGAPRRRRQVLRRARQPRRRRTDQLQGVQHGRPEVLHLQAQARRAVLRARQQLRGRQAAGVAQQGAGGKRIRLEDRLLPPSAVFVRRHPRLRRSAARADRAGVPEIRRQRRLHGPRALLRADQAAEGRRLLHRRVVGEAAEGRSAEVGAHGLRQRLRTTRSCSSRSRATSCSFRPSTTRA